MNFYGPLPALPAEFRFRSCNRCFHGVKRRPRRHCADERGIAAVPNSRLLSAECATDRLRLRFSAEDIVLLWRTGSIAQGSRVGHRACTTTTAHIARQVSDPNSIAPPRASSFQEEKVLAAIDQCASIPQDQRKEYRPQGLPLGTDQHSKMKPFFRLALLAGIRIVELRNHRIPNPPFYAKAKTLGFTNLPELAHMASLTFDDVVVFPSEINGPALISRAGTCAAVQGS